MTDITKLRPVERRVLDMHSEGQSASEIAGTLRWSPEHVERVIGWIEIPRTRRPDKYAKALEARVLAMRDQGLSHEEISDKFRRSADNIRLIEALAHYRQAIETIREID